MSPPRLYCDTSVYVEVLLGSSAPGYAESFAALQAAEHGVYEGMLSALVPAEVVGAPAIRAPQGLAAVESARRMDQALRVLQNLPFRYLEIDKSAGLRAAEIARQYEMKGADALHVAVAQLNGCSLFFSLDHDQLKVADRIPGLVIGRPRGPAQGELELG
ncbi:type II toxin-antitoxin system VapC family toxin [uncultured Friedmanniella sp.]|uniref:type II toxin-antitoxin system VapC family toxin n=1 Tax=uncultured Friedmanniella sp. TaxID=335381 RepID=UPI0035CB9FB9